MTASANINFPRSYPKKFPEHYEGEGASREAVMAALVSISFSLPLLASKTLTKEKLQGKSALGLLRSSHKTSRTAVNLLLTPKCSSRSVFSADWSCHRHITPLSKQFCEPVFSYLNVISTSHVVLSGYWVGPDVEDGWGFVEAFVNQIL